MVHSIQLNSSWVFIISLLSIAQSTEYTVFSIPPDPIFDSIQVSICCIHLYPYVSIYHSTIVSPLLFPLISNFPCRRHISIHQHETKILKSRLLHIHHTCTQPHPAPPGSEPHRQRSARRCAASSGSTCSGWRWVLQHTSSGQIHIISTIISGHIMRLFVPGRWWVFTVVFLKSRVEDQSCIVFVSSSSIHLEQITVDRKWEIHTLARASHSCGCSTRCANNGSMAQWLNDSQCWSRWWMRCDAVRMRKVEGWSGDLAESAGYTITAIGQSEVLNALLYIYLLKADICSLFALFILIIISIGIRNQECQAVALVHVLYSMTDHLIGISVKRKEWYIGR